MQLKGVSVWERGGWSTAIVSAGGHLGGGEAAQPDAGLLLGAADFSDPDAPGALAHAAVDGVAGVALRLGLLAHLRLVLPGRRGALHALVGVVLLVLPGVARTRCIVVRGPLIAAAKVILIRL